MKPASFEYVRPGSLAEAVELVSRHGDACRPLAGGQSLIPLLAMRLARPALLVDLCGVGEMRGVATSEGVVRVGAMTRQHELEEDARLPPLVRSAIPLIGHFQIRNRGTVGGSLAHMDPAAEWPALALAMAAVLVAAGPRGQRQIAADDFPTGPLATALEADELLLEIRLPAKPARSALLEVARRPGDFALVGAVRHGGRLVVFGAGPVPQRLAAAEAHLAAGGGAGPELTALAHGEIEAGGDIHAPAAYRRQVGAQLVNRVAGQAA